MQCKICGNKLETEAEEIEGVCEDCRGVYYSHGIFGLSLKEETSEYYPISFWQDAPLKRDDAIEWGDGEITRINPKMQAALASFANTWMKNIKEQQGLVI